MDLSEGILLHDLSVWLPPLGCQSPTGRQHCREGGGCWRWRWGRLATTMGQGILQNGPSLAEVLKPGTITPLLSNPEIQSRLAQSLPQEHPGAAWRW